MRYRTLVTAWYPSLVQMPVPAWVATTSPRRRAADSTPMVWTTARPCSIAMLADPTG